MCVECHNNCQKQRNKILYNGEKHKERIVRWYEKEKKKAEMSVHAPGRMFVKRSKINVKNSQVETIKTWIMNIKDIERKVEKLPCNDIRRYFELG